MPNCRKRRRRQPPGKRRDAPNWPSWSMPTPWNALPMTIAHRERGRLTRAGRLAASRQSVDCPLCRVDASRSEGKCDRDRRQRPRGGRGHRRRTTAGRAPRAGGRSLQFRRVKDESTTVAVCDRRFQCRRASAGNPIEPACRRRSLDAGGDWKQSHRRRFRSAEQSDRRRGRGHRARGDRRAGTRGCLRQPEAGHRKEPDGRAGSGDSFASVCWSDSTCRS